ncbi:MAG: FtsQ-type POTRA domain-containing protein [Candidatus Eremiobacteraeota bacterium]|nr:FtsQ-type POTRA domain-containing protein [Candidatus Eremiobacteraeota bacterium]
MGSRLGRFWVLGLIVGVALVFAGWTLATLPAFHLHELTVTGAQRVSRAQIVARAAIDPERNVWLLDRSAAERRVESIPYVLAARVHRRLPADVWIEVTERRPYACVHDADGHEFIVDAELRVLEELCTPDAAVTFDVRSTLDAGPGAFLRDRELRALEADALALASHGDRYRAFSHDAYGELEATMYGGIVVRFGDDDDLDRKQRLIQPILAELGPRLGNVRTVDLRAPATPVVEYRK